jgi:hypothetical protein
MTWTKEETQEYYREYVKEHKDDRQAYLETNKEKIKDQTKLYYNTNKGEISIQKKIYREKIKLRAFEVLGGARCSNPKCLVPGGCSDIRTLQIDHKHGGGYKEITEISTRGIYWKIINDPEKAKNEYQVLCANCNWIKRHVNHESRT